MGTLIQKFIPGAEPVSACVWASDGRSFTLGSLDRYNSLHSWNIADERLCHWVTKHRVQNLCGNDRRLIALDTHYTVYVYSMETRELEFRLALERRPVSVSISQDEQSLLLKSIRGEILLVDMASQNVIQKYKGPIGGDFSIGCGYGGAHDEFILSGSEGKTMPFSSLPETLANHYCLRWIYLGLGQTDCCCSSTTRPASS